LKISYSISWDEKPYRKLLTQTFTTKLQPKLSH
jgi:hypothetical protein